MAMRVLTFHCEFGAEANVEAQQVHSKGNVAYSTR